MEKTNLTDKEELLFGKVGEKDKIDTTMSVHQQIIALWMDSARDLDLAQRIINIYPFSHPTVVKVVERINENFQKLLATKGEITLGVFQDRLLLDGELLELEEEGEIHKKFAMELHKRGVATLTFSKGLGVRNIQKFLEIITTDPETILKEGGIARVFLENKLNFIRVNEVDYTGILSGQEESPGLKGAREDKTAIANYLVGKAFTTEEEAAGALFELMDDPNKMAGLIFNISKGKGDLAAVKAIDKIADLAKGGKEEKMKKKLARVISSLDPDLRLKLFKMERPAAAPGEKDQLGKIIPHLSEKEIVDILTHALSADEDKASLARVLNRLVPGRDRRKATLSLFRGELMKKGVIKGGQEADWKELEGSLLPEEEDRYLGEADKKRLISLEKETASKKDEYTEEERRKVTSLFEPIEEESLAREETLMLLDMLGLKEEREDCLEIIGQIGQRIKEYVHSSKYDLLCKVLKGLNRIISSKDKGFPFRQELSSKAIDDLSGEITEDLILALYESAEEGEGEKEKYEEILGLFFYLSENITSPLMEQLAEEGNRERRFVLISALTSLKKIALEELIKWLDDPRWYVARNVIHILGKRKEKGIIKSLLKPLRNKEARVRLETVRTLGELGEIEALDLLVLGLRDKDKNIRQLSLRYLAAIGGERSISTLLRILKVGPYDLKVEAIKALGGMGSDRAVAGLILILKSHSLWGIRKSNRLRICAASALGQIGGEKALMALRGGIDFSFSRVVRKACQEALGNQK